MRVFVTGATGAIGRHLVPDLVAAGHEVTATTRTPAKLGDLRAAGAEPVLLDGLDRAAVVAAVAAAGPEVIVHQMTALSRMRSLRNVDRVFAETNDLRTRGTDHLLAAAAAAGTRRVVAQSHNFIYAHAGGPVKSEDDPLFDAPMPNAERSIAAIRHVDRVVPESVPEGLVLRFGTFYGPDDRTLPDLVRQRRMPVVGGGTGIWSFVDTRDAASATAAAVERGDPGPYNVVDDDPAPVAEWLPYLAGLLGAKPPRRLPASVARPLAGTFVVAQMTTARGASNAKAKAKLGWEPRVASWREGFRAWV